MNKFSLRFSFLSILIAVTFIATWAMNSFGITPSDIAPPVNQTVTTAGPSTGSPRAMDASQPPLGAWVYTEPVLLPSYDSTTFTPAATALMSNVLAGVKIPSEYQISWSNLITPSPQVVWALVELNSGNSSDTISLDMLNVVTSSSDTGNALASTNGFVGSTYSALAPLITAGGSVVTSGPASTLGRSALVLVCSPLFTASPSTVEQWVGQQIADRGSYSLTYMAMAGRNASTSVTVSTKASVPAVKPILEISRTGNGANISVRNASSTASYQIVTSTALAGPWIPDGVINGTNSMTVNVSGGARFYRATVQ